MRAFPAPDALRPAWARGYDARDFRDDVVAGLTVGVVLVPQAMAYAVLAGVPPIYGLYSSVVPLLLYPLFGTSRHMAAGVNAISMVVVAAGIGALAEPDSVRYVELVILLTFMVGVTELAMAVARLGFLADLLSRPVISGFTVAAAVIIVASQLGDLLGIELARQPYLWQTLWTVGAGLDHLHVPSLTLGGAAIALLAAARRWAPRFPAELVVLAVATAVAAALGLPAAGVDVVGNVPGGLARPSLPAFELDAIAELWPTALTLALVQFMSVVSLGEAFAARHGYGIDANRELAAIGAGNLGGSLFRAIPSSGSFSRTAVNEAAGARSPIANVAAAGVVVLVLLFLTPLFRTMPEPALAAIVIVAGATLVRPRELRKLFRVKRSDGWIAVVTVLATLGVGIEEGIFVGVTTAALVVIFRLSRPRVSELGLLPGTRTFRNLENFPRAERLREILVLRVDAGLTFLSAKYLRDQILALVEERERPVRYVIVDGVGINFLDSTAAKSLMDTVDELAERGIEIHFAGLKAVVRQVVRDAGLGHELGLSRFHLSVHRAVDQVLSEAEGPESGRRRRYHEATEREHEIGRGPTAGQELT